MKSVCRVQKWYAQSLEEYYSHIHTIGEMIRAEEGRDGMPPILWYRGHQFHYYNLQPNILRDIETEYNESYTYSNIRLREDYRFQHFMARNFSKVEIKPSSIMEWQEIMQHYLAKTRLMDWSESATTAALFALEAFIDPSRDKELLRRRKEASPTVWVLDPVELNSRIYDAIPKNALVQKALEGYMDKETARRLGSYIKKELTRENKKKYFELSDPSEHNMNGIIGLSALEFMRNTYDEMGIAQALKNGGLNPFFFLLLRYYSDGLAVETGVLPPVATIHPYHSPRIQAQKGAFTVFPYYMDTEETKKLKKLAPKYQAGAMENMEICKSALYEIQITDPCHMASELLLSGERRGSLYPEMDVSSKDIENGRYYI